MNIDFYETKMQVVADIHGRTLVLKTRTSIKSNWRYREDPNSSCPKQCDLLRLGSGVGLSTAYFVKNPAEALFYLGLRSSHL